jgi:hypothetical protein
MKVVALTNYGCLSAGDGASLYLSNLPNVTLAGLTDPYGCNQETGGVSVLSGGHVYVGFPVGLVLDGNGDPNIDTRADRISRNPVEERIPLNYDAAMKIFRDKEDYELEWAVQYLENAYAYDNWIDSVTDEQGVYIGQDKEVVGYYKRIGIAKVGGTYEEMLELRDIEKRGYLVAADDGTAYFELDGEKTEYVFDSGNFYLSKDTDRANGFRYTCINGRLIIDDGTFITQYLRLTDEELASYIGRN